MGSACLRQALAPVDELSLSLKPVASRMLHGDWHNLFKATACMFASGSGPRAAAQGSMAKKLKFSWGFLVDAKDYIFSSAIHLQIAQCSFTISSGRFCLHFIAVPSGALFLT